MQEKINKIPTVGILALQGDYQAHANALRSNSIGRSAEIIFVKSADQLGDLDALIFPGGESSAMLRLLKEEFIEGILLMNSKNKILYGTCAGAILLAKSVENPVQNSLALIDIDIKRNAYGRQLDSFITKSLSINSESSSAQFLNPNAEAVFIRAPKITRVGPNVETLCSYKNDPVLVKEKNILISTFHPELSLEPHFIYEILFNMIES